MSKEALNQKGQRAVAFIDILGFKKLIETNKQEMILEILKKFSALNRSESSDTPENTMSNIAVSSYSDHIVISIGLDHSLWGYGSPAPLRAMTDATNRLSAITLSKGVLIRGGIAYGECYHEGNIVSGKALLEAIELEKTAVYPRIIISNTVPDPWIEYMCRIDFDGVSYISFMSPRCFPYDEKLAKVLIKLRNFIVTNLNDYRDNTAIYAKWAWLGQYFNIILQEWKKVQPNDAELGKLHGINITRKIDGKPTVITF